MATGSKYPHDLQDGDVFWHQNGWHKADFIAIGRPSIQWVTVQTEAKPLEDPMVVMLPAAERVLVIQTVSEHELSARRDDARRQNIRNKTRRY